MALNHTVQGSVNYTVVGSPTISNGIASGFSDSDFLRLTSYPPTSDITKYEFYTKFTVASLEGGQQFILKFTAGISAGLSILSGGRLNFSFGRTGDSSASYVFTNITSSANLQIGDTVLMKAGYEGDNTFYLQVSTDNGATWIKDTTISSSIPTIYTPSAVALGCGDGYANHPFLGSIDLNETYIKVNGQAWFGICPVEVKHINYGTSVGYTVVGSPTISNGVVANSSNSNYVQLSQTFDGSKDHELQYKFKFTESFTGSRALQLPSSGYYNAIDITGGQFVYYPGRNEADTSYVSFSCNYIFALNTDYWIRITKEGTTYKGYISTDGDSFTLLKEQTISDCVPSSSLTLNPCKQGSGKTFPGSIDLNETYIKVNGKLWFYKPCTNYLVKDNKLVFADSGLYLSGPVNYAVEGTPTIVDGLASGFSSSDYLVTPNIGNKNKFAIETRFSVLSNSENNMTFIGLGPSACRLVIVGGSNKCIASLSNGSVSNNLDPNFIIAPGNFYYAKFIREDNNYTFSISSDKENWSTATLSDFAIQNFNRFYFGVQYSTGGSYQEVFAGSIDLNETYIKVNDVLWFYGKNYASKNIAPVPSGYTYGTTTTSAIGFVDMRTQAFTAAPAGATLGKDE